MHLLPLLLLIPLTFAAPSLGARGDRTPCGRRNTPRYCAGTNYTASLTSTYLCGDSRLGPTKLPRGSDDDASVTSILANVLFTYDRFGGLCPGEFIAAWFNETIGWWNYPPENGFELGENEDGSPVQNGNGGGKPIQGNVTLEVDTLLDRFGSEGGTFVSPAGAPYMQRALPPSNLVGTDPV